LRVGLVLREPGGDSTRVGHAKEGLPEGLLDVLLRQPPRRAEHGVRSNLADLQHAAPASDMGGP
jgi:hypothetical protein